MAIRTKVEPIARDVSLLLADALGPQVRSQLLADFARRQLAEAAEINRAATGHGSPVEVFVDGRKGAPLENVRPDGVIVGVFDLMDDLFEWIGEMLVRNSPVRSGDYAASHTFLADGVAIDPGAKVPEAAEYVFVNVQPYARKIERGLSPQARDGVYEVVAVLASKRFGNVARIRFGFRSPLFGAVDEWAGRTALKSPSPSRNRPGAQRREWLTRQPAIIITRR